MVLRSCISAAPSRRSRARPRRGSGLAASYDQLKRWELADRAYGEAIKIAGPTADILNNRGYSYLLRGDIRRASQDLSPAAAKDPETSSSRTT